MGESRLHTLAGLGQSPWIDFLSRNLIKEGELARMMREDAIAGVRGLMGTTHPKDAAPGTIRGDFATLLGENVVHGSDSRASAKRELKLFFPNGLL